MFNSDGKPRYWLGAYDAWHLAIPVALAGVLAGLAFSPSTGRTPAKPRPAASAPIPMPPTVWIHPTNRLTMPARQFGVLEGQGLPGGTLILRMRQLPNLERELIRRPVGPDGRFSVRLTLFPPGDYGFRAEVVGPDGRSSSTFEVPVTLTPDPVPAPATQSPSSRKATPNRRRPSRS